MVCYHRVEWQLYITKRNTTCPSCSLVICHRLPSKYNQSEIWPTDYRSKQFKLLSCFAAATSVIEFTHWGPVTHICASKLTVIGSDNGLSPGRLQAIIWTNAALLLIGPLWTNFSDILNKIHQFSFTNMLQKTSSRNGGHFVQGEMTEDYCLIFLPPLVLLS